MVKALVTNKSVTYSKEDLLSDTLQVRQIIITEHDGLFLELVDSFIARVQSFGFYFASLDIRQESSVHQEVIDSFMSGDADHPLYSTLSDEIKFNFLPRFRS
jgi:phosphoenolpyruvate carboxylase